MENKTILIVDDTVSNLDILIELLQEYDVVDTTNGKEALEITSEEKIDLILLDIMMPDMDGFEVCKKLKENAETKDIPVIFITAKIDEDSIEKAYDIGGNDYVSKPFKPKELLAKVKRELRLQELQDKLKLLASTDPMTKLYNRRYFTQMSKHLLDLSKREKSSLSIVMIDIDKFKNINDTYGHAAGDKVIIALSNLLIKLNRKSDLICRYGGEEFVVLLQHTSLDGAIAVANKLREKVELFIMENSIRFTISLGVSTVDLLNDSSIEKALNRADYALYESKNSGRNRVSFKV